MTGPGYFDDLYAENADPWDLSASPYERRKLALLLASLPSRRYRSAFEPGCAIGVTTAALAARCDRLLALDGAVAAVAQAQARVTDSHVTIARGLVPRDWPTGSFDLIVLSELLYYLDDSDRLAVASRVSDALLPGGDVVAVHWRHGFAAAATNGDVVHAELGRRLGESGLARTVDHVEEHFLLQVYGRPTGSTTSASGSATAP